VVQGRHPFVEVTHSGSFIANDLFLGGNTDGSDAFNEASILLLSQTWYVNCNDDDHVL
jgi:DNA mismatch repair ATPase MutS